MQAFVSSLCNFSVGVLSVAITERMTMPTLSDSRRKKIQARQRKANNALKRAAKIAKRQRNSAK
jgi:hypothetical protein